MTAPFAAVSTETVVRDEMPLPDGTTAFVRWQRKNGWLDVNAKMPEGWHVAKEMLGTVPVRDK